MTYLTRLATLARPSAAHGRMHPAFERGFVSVPASIPANELRRLVAEMVD